MILTFLLASSTASLSRSSNHVLKGNSANTHLFRTPLDAARLARRQDLLPEDWACAT